MRAELSARASLRLWAGVAVGLLLAVNALALDIEEIQPTPLFPKLSDGQPLRQLALIRLSNPAAPLALVARISMGKAAPYAEELGDVPSGKSVRRIHVPDIAAPTKVAIEVIDKATGGVLARRETDWQPQKKWKIYSVSYCHQDLGYATYPHRLRHDNRHVNIDLALKYCAETDAWDEDSKFRYVVESGEPLTSYLGSRDEAVAEELARRVREGRIQIGALHSTVDSEQLSHEGLARLFYLSRRHAQDLLGTPGGRTAQLDDVIGLTWPLATFSAEAGVDYFFHGHNHCGYCGELEQERLAFWEGPGGTRQSRVLAYSFPYGGDAIQAPEIKPGDPFQGALAEEVGSGGDPLEGVVMSLIKRYAEFNWPYDAILSQDGFDFTATSLKRAKLIQRWNARFSYPKMVCATMDMYFDQLKRQLDPAKIKTFAKDGNNEWADEHPSNARALATARRTGEAIPTAEKFSALAAALTPGEYPWTDIYQAYHRLLSYQEHTVGAAFWAVRRKDGAEHYETEQAEHQEMAEEAASFAGHALDESLHRLAGAITTQAAETLVVFNPLNRIRTDLARVGGSLLPETFVLRDGVTGHEVPAQRMADGSICFVARDVPSLGYKTFTVEARTKSPGGTAETHGRADELENRFYRVRFDAATGGITSIFDKELKVELVEQAAPLKFNEYLYERIETPQPKTATSTWYRVESAKLAVTRGPVASVMTISASAVGAEYLVQTVTLYQELKRIDFGMAFDKSASGRTLHDYAADNAQGKESLYIGLPLAVPEFRIVHELPGGVVEPLRQQFQNTCTAFYAVRHFTDLSNTRFGVTVSPIDSALVEYGYPRSCPLYRQYENESRFERAAPYPAHSRLYLYLLDNMFDTNVRIDQRGPMSFSWSLRSHAGDWKAGKADQFGWDTHNPLLTRLVSGAQPGTLPSGSGSLVMLDKPNVVCTTLKPAEINGSGYILRFVETQGRQTKATLRTAFLPGAITRAVETDLVENDRSVSLPVRQGKAVSFSISPYGVKTIRLLAKPKTPAARVAALSAVATSDMQVRLSWPADPSQHSRRYLLYRGKTADFRPSLINLVARPGTNTWLDQPKLQFGGWLNNRLEPESTYYYRVAAVDAANNPGQLSDPVAVTTLKSSVGNMAPLPVERLQAILVSPLSDDNYVNLLWRSNCESDVRRYEIHRSTTAGFLPDKTTWIADAEDKENGNYDHRMYQDRTVQPGTTYYYCVRAIDGAGQQGAFSATASVRTK